MLYYLQFGNAVSRYYKVTLDPDTKILQLCIRFALKKKSSPDKILQSEIFHGLSWLEKN